VGSSARVEVWRSRCVDPFLDAPKPGANCFIAGSGLFAYDDMSQGVKELKGIAEEYQKKA